METSHTLIMVFYVQTLVYYLNIKYIISKEVIKLMDDCKSLSFTVIGGDQRQLELIKIIADKKGMIRSLGFINTDIDKVWLQSKDILHHYDTLNPELFLSDIIFLPIPCKDKNGLIPMKYSTLSYETEKIINCIKKESMVFLGKCDNEVKKIVFYKGLNIIDLLENEEFSIVNAIPTAEGAIQIAMENSYITLHGSNCLILGYGRIGKVLSKMLKGIGANVFVATRKLSDQIWIRENGYQAVDITNIKDIIHVQNFVFNTIPFLIINSTIIPFVNKNTLLMDLASLPGGIDLESAKGAGLHARLDLGLPGIVAPKTTAMNILYTALRLYNNNRNS